MSVYLDCNATTPINSLVLDYVLQFMTNDFGNAGSRTHEFGARARQAVNHAREQIANVVKAKSDEVIFTSGATESNNISILGLANIGKTTNRCHIISTQIEHKAILEPLEFMSKNGFEITFVPPTSNGWIDPAAIEKAIRPDTLLVSVMHVNNETGVLQPISEIADTLLNHPAFFHIDAAQSFGKLITPLQNNRIDLISISGHKIFAPKGIGALVIRRRGFKSIPLQPLMFGGGQERKLRPGTLPVHLIAGLGLASEIAHNEHITRFEQCQKFKERLLEKLLPLNPHINGDLEKSLPNSINVSFQGVDSEALMLTLKDEIAISNGSACTSNSYQPSHVLKAMKLSNDTIKGAIRLSWYHETEEPDWEQVVLKIKQLL
jgi:cysteine desulfurase